MSKRVHEKKVIKLTKEILTQRSEAGQKRREVRLSGTKTRNEANYLDGIAGKKFHATRKADKRVKGQTVIKPLTMFTPNGKKVTVSRRQYKDMRKAGMFRKANKQA